MLAGYSIHETHETFAVCMHITLKIWGFCREGIFVSPRNLLTLDLFKSNQIPICENASDSRSAAMVETITITSTVWPKINRRWYVSAKSHFGCWIVYFVFSDANDSRLNAAKWREVMTSTLLDRIAYGRAVDSLAKFSQTQWRQSTAPASATTST